MLTVYRNGTLSEDLYITCVEKLIADVKEGYMIVYSTVLSGAECEYAECQFLSFLDGIEASGATLKAPIMLSEDFSACTGREGEINLFVTEKILASYTKWREKNLKGAP